MILVDNSLFARNGDILPTRWDSQVEAIHLLSNAKLNDNQESTVGLMLMGGRNPEVTFHDLTQKDPGDSHQRPGPDQCLYKQNQNLGRAQFHNGS